MKNRAVYYFNPQDYSACKELRQAYLNEADGDAYRAMLALCIDMAALDAYVSDIEQWALRRGMDITTASTLRPCSPRTPGFRLPPRISRENGSSKRPPEAEWADEVRRRLQAWTGRGSSSTVNVDFGFPYAVESAS
ncbi:MAG: hypothetical protein C3F11_00920 [Methylocystaceae bacterium]|nr:MAG: hypothetical protein C3F11_00920 [Methylocystaceae bacterium]